MTSKVFSVTDIEDLSKVTKYLISLMRTNRIFLMTGDLGAGKTTLAKRWVKDLNISDSVSSPTFSLINEYQGSGICIYHMDMYRLKDIEEAYNIGIEEYLYDSGHYNIIEWPEIVMDLIVAPYVQIIIKVENGARIIEVVQHND